MRETSFIKQNKEKWKEFEKILEHKDSDPDKLNNLFIQITDDLSYSRTFYPNRSVRVYLNNLAQQVFYNIYKNKKTRLGRLVSFWTDDLPQLIYTARKEFMLSFAVFLLAFIIGAFSSAMDPEFPRIILGDDYVDMTLENIESGDPMAVYKKKGQFSMTLGITANNLFVAMLTFIMGIVYCIGTLAILISNGVMVGAFQYFFYEQGLLRESFLTIWMHGTLEISAIIIAGAAGLTMGKGLVFPGTLSRIQAFQVSARRGLKIMIGITPIIILAGFIESYFTRYTETPDIIRAAFILLCLAFVLGYFVWYPWLKAKNGFSQPIRDTQLPQDIDYEIGFDRIKSSGEIFADIFIIYKRSFRQIVWAAVFVGLAFCTWSFLSGEEDPSSLFFFTSGLFASLGGIGQLFNNGAVPFLPIANILIYSVFAVVIFSILRKESIYPERMQQSSTSIALTFIKTLTVVSALQLIMMVDSEFSIFLFFLLTPILLILGYVMFKEESSPIAAVSRTFQLLKNQYGRAIGLFFLLMCIGLLFFCIMSSSLLWFYFELIGWNLSLKQETLDQVGAIILTFLSVFTLSLILGMIILGLGLLYYTLLEILEANNLKERIRSIGQGRRIQGMEKER